MEFLINNWLTLVTLISSPISLAIGWFLGGKKAKQQELQKGNVEIESAEIDYAVKVKDLYEELLTRATKENEILKNDRDSVVIEVKSEREYFRNRIDEMEKKANLMQEQFNTIQLAYAKEVEQSQNWEKLHRELTDKYNALAKDHEELKTFCEKIKIELDKYKKKKE